jgi:nicotinamide-nucleotide amidase
MERTKKSPEKAVGELLKKKGLTLSAAESCTGGLLSSIITDVPGSSGYFTGSVIAYDNEVKKKTLGVRSATLRSTGRSR